MLTKKFAVIFLTVLMIFSLTGISASAATTTQDGLEVTLTTDKTEYTKNEQITATLMVKNTNSEAVSNVTVETLIPKGYKVSDGASTNKIINELHAGEAVNLSVTYLPNKASTNVTSSEGGKGTDNKNNSAGNTVNSNGNSVSSSGNTSSPKTGIIRNLFIVFLIFIVAGISIAIMLVLKKRTAKGMLSFFLCVGVISMTAIATINSVSAAENQSNSINVKEIVKVDNEDLTLNAIVKYDFVSSENENQSTDSEQTTDTTELKADDEYFNENAEKVVDVIKVEESSTVPTESEVVNILKSRGFEEGPVTYECMIDGEYVGETDVSENSSEKHPIYMTYYLSKNNEAWSIFVINGDIFANPVS